MIKYGIKLWSVNKIWFEEAVRLCQMNKVDFVELYIVPDSLNLGELKLLKQITVFVHNTHCGHHFNLFELNEEKIKFFQDQVLKTADFLESRFIVVHPGVGESSKVFRENIVKIKDPRILIENMPKIGFVGVLAPEGALCFGHSKEQLEFIHQECGFDICLDFVHSVAAAVSQRIEYKGFINSLITALNPYYFHISGGHTSNPYDEHLDVFEGNFDMQWIKGMLLELAREKDIYLVFETPKKGPAFQNDIKNIHYFKSL